MGPAPSKTVDEQVYEITDSYTIPREEKRSRLKALADTGNYAAANAYSQFMVNMGFPPDYPGSVDDFIQERQTIDSTFSDLQGELKKRQNELRAYFGQTGQGYDFKNLYSAQTFSSLDDLTTYDQDIYNMWVAILGEEAKAGRTVSESVKEKFEHAKRTADTSEEQANLQKFNVPGNFQFLTTDQRNNFEDAFNDYYSANASYYDARYGFENISKNAPQYLGNNLKSLVQDADFRNEFNLQEMPIGQNTQNVYQRRQQLQAGSPSVAGVNTITDPRYQSSGNTLPEINTPQNLIQ